jgi:phenylpropionate dioxygenase-like ring-hydroxylating dioxygenase large terminal subunit
MKQTAVSVAAISENVTDKPLGVDILGTRVTLFRDEEGKVVCVDDTCPHR